MYKKKIPFDFDCGLRIAMEVMGGKWKSCIIRELSTESKRPSELHRTFPDVSPRVINQQLKELEMHGVVTKKIFAELPPHSEYTLTDTGKSLLPLIDQLEAWGNEYRPRLEQITEMKKEDEE